MWAGPAWLPHRPRVLPLSQPDSTRSRSRDGAPGGQGISGVHGGGSCGPSLEPRPSRGRGIAPQVRGRGSRLPKGGRPGFGAPQHASAGRGPCHPRSEAAPRDPPHLHHLLDPGTRVPEGGVALGQGVCPPVQVQQRCLLVLFPLKQGGGGALLRGEDTGLCCRAGRAPLRRGGLPGRHQQKQPLSAG